MIDADERQKAFLEDLQKLLKKHGAELEVTDNGAGYGMQQGVCNISMMSVWSEDKLEKDFCEFDLPTYMDGGV